MSRCPLCHVVHYVTLSVVEVGEGKSLIASRYFGSGSMVESDSLNPAHLYTTKKSSLAFSLCLFEGFLLQASLLVDSVRMELWERFLRIKT